MGSQDNSRSKLEQIPNSVSGDGKTFVSQLKKFLQAFKNDTQEKIDGIGAGAVEQVFGLQLSEEHDYDSKGNPINNIFVEFDNTNVSNYLNAQIWMKKSTENAYHMVGTTSNVTYTIPDVLAGTTYYVKVVACNTNSGTADFDDAPYDDITIQGSVLVPAAPTQFYLTFDDEGPLWEWQFVDNGYVDFFELRLDGYAGTWNANRLDSTRNSFSRAVPPVRSGTAYLFIRNVYGMYSLPATHQFNIAAPAKPNAPTLEMTLDGVVITMDALPFACYGYELEITDWEGNTEIFSTSNSQYVYFQFMGTISVRYRFVDAIGHGEWSDPTNGTVQVTLPIGRLPAIDYSMFNAATQAAIDKATTALTTAEDIQDQLEGLILTPGGGGTTEFTALQSQVDADAGRISQIIANLGVTPDGQNSYAAINRLKSDYNGLQSTVTSHTTSLNTNSTAISQLTQRANGFDTTVQTLNNGLATNASNITQTANSLTAVVTALNSNNPSQTGFSAITALSNGIDLCVKDVDLDGSELVSRINISPNGTEISGKYLHITGDTEIDGGVIIGGKIASGTITGSNIASNTITGGKIAAGTITNAKIADGTLETSKIKDGQITTEKVADNAITSTQIKDGAIVTGKIAANAVNSAKIAANAVTATKIAAGSILTSHINAEKLDATAIKTHSITSDQIQVGSIIGDSISGNTISGDKIKAGAVDAIHIKANAITADKIRAGAVTAAKISVDNLQAVSANVGKLTGGSLTGTTLIGGTIRNSNSTFIVSANGDITGASLTASSMTSGTITGGTITGATIIGSVIQNAASNPTFSVDANGNIKGATLTAGTVKSTAIADGAVTSAKIYSGSTQANRIQAGNLATGSVTSVKIADGAVVAGKVAANAIVAGNIAANAVVAGNIAADAVDTDQIKAGAINANKLAANAVEANKIKAGAVTAGKIAANAVDADQIKAGAVTAGKIATNAVEADKIKAGAVTAQKIYSGNVQANRIQADNIATGAVTATKISVDNLQAVSANVGNLTGGSLTGTELIGGTIRNANSSFTVSANGAIKGASLTSSTLTSGTITGGTITGAKLIGSTIQNAASNPTFSVDANGNIKGATLTSATISTGSISADLITSAGFQVKASIIKSDTVSGNGGTIPLPSGYTEAQCLWMAYPPSYPSTHPDTSNYLKYRYESSHFSIAGRTVTAYATYILTTSQDGGVTYTARYYPSIPYRIIGIK